MQTEGSQSLHWIMSGLINANLKDLPQRDGTEPDGLLLTATQVQHTNLAEQPRSRGCMSERRTVHWLPDRYIRPAEANMPTELATTMHVNCHV